MEKPDADGFIRVTWPSKTIPYGGIFHSRVVEPSAAQQKFLQVLLEESKLSIAQRQKTAWALRQEDEKKSYEPEVHVPQVRPRTSRRRSLSVIRESGAFEINQYRPIKRGEDREKLKERLANTMAYGDTQEQKPPPPPKLVKPPPQLPTNKEMRNELLTQIRERAEWLAEMEDLGHAEPHRDIVRDQIAERLRALDALGIESDCSSVRSGFSTLRSRENVEAALESARTASSAAKSEHSNKSAGSRKTQKSTRSSAKGKKEENVAAYKNTPWLQYSPRRRV